MSDIRRIDAKVSELSSQLRGVQGKADGGKPNINKSIKKAKWLTRTRIPTERMTAGLSQLNGVYGKERLAALMRIGTQSQQ